jgi:hypothetical protein
MQFFPRNGHCLARLQVFDSTRHLRIPSLMDRARFIRTIKSVEQGVGKCGSLVNGERKRPFEKIGNLRTHGVILPHMKRH